jgi:hypothetical protein
MKKTILATLLITTIAINGIFALTSYTGTTPQSAILDVTQTPVPYTFILQYENAGTSGTQTVAGEKLDATGGTTGIFNVETSITANMGKAIQFTTELTTGEFVGNPDTSVVTGWYPTIIEKPSTVLRVAGNAPGITYTPETVSYTATTNGAYRAASVGTYTVTLQPGTHTVGSHIASFTLDYKGDENVVAGAYRSTSTISIISDETN